jgi:DNA-binding GntR family transcriptional regulator
MGSPAIGPLQTAGSFRQSVEQAVAAAIISGEMTPGTMLTAPTLAARFDVSATPVREALLNLEKRGFVEIVRNKGFRVTQVSEHDLWEIVQIRQSLEAPPMRQIARALPAAALAQLRTEADAIVAGAAAGDLPAHLAADIAFHLHLLSLAGNDRLVDLVADLRQRTRLVGLATLLGTPELANSAHEHHTLLDLLEAGDGAAAEELLRHHIGHVTGWWSGHSETNARS